MFYILYPAAWVIAIVNLKNHDLQNKGAIMIGTCQI